MKNVWLHISTCIYCFVTILLFTVFGFTESIEGIECDEYVQYIVKEGDSLESIAFQFGDEKFIEVIYRVNIDFVDNPRLLLPGQTLRIPINIAEYKESELTLSEVLENPSCRPKEVAAGDSVAIVDENKEKHNLSEDKQDKLLEAFREAFEALSEAEQDSVEEDNHVKAEQKILTGISGMVIDETRSKIGRDFYDVFYQNWQPPENASGFTITINEQPAPGLGTVILVKANDTETFRYRLQPRYDFIQEAARYAVRITYNHLQNNPQDFVIY